VRILSIVELFRGGREASERQRPVHRVSDQVGGCLRCLASAPRRRAARQRDTRPIEGTAEAASHELHVLERDRGFRQAEIVLLCLERLSRDQHLLRNGLDLRVRRTAPDLSGEETDCRAKHRSLRASPLGLFDPVREQRLGLRSAAGLRESNAESRQ
jgi:hypothetical protein